MRASRVGLLVTALVLGGQMPAAAQETLIAHYPLNQDSVDVTGNYGPLELINTPYQETGIYCNGIYIFDVEPNGCLARTPQITDLDFESFKISARFKVLDSLTVLRPVFVGGTGWRWIGASLEADGRVSLRFGGGAHATSEMYYQIGTWHTITVTYDGSTDLGRLYLDGNFAVSQEFELAHGDDRDISTTDFSGGATFKGILSDLRIYGDEVGIDEPSGPHPSTHLLLKVHPNPCAGSATIAFSLPGPNRTDISIYTLSGHKLTTLLDTALGSGEHQLQWSPTAFPTGTYICRLTTPQGVTNQPLVIRR